MKEKILEPTSNNTFDREDLIASLVKNDLSDLLASLRDDYDRQNKGEWIRVFSVDFNEDQKEIKKCIKAVKRVLQFY